jgi:hypothetical protein
MDTTQLLDRLRALAPRQGMSLGVTCASSYPDFVLLLASAGGAFGVDEALTEYQVNDRLKGWLAGPGAMLAVDHVELRRWMVDNGVLARDGYGRVYTRGNARAEIAEAMRCLGGQDLAAIVADARARDIAKREARKAQWVKA